MNKKKLQSQNHNRCGQQTIVKTLNEHNHGVDSQKTESQQLRIRVRKASG